MANNTFKYYKNEKGELKIEMTQNAAKEVKATLTGFRAGIEKSGFSEKTQLLFMGQYVADEFLKDTVSWALTQEDVETDGGTISGPTMFLQMVEKKIEDLLG